MGKQLVDAQSLGMLHGKTHKMPGNSQKHKQFVKFSQVDSGKR